MTITFREEIEETIASAHSWGELDGDVGSDEITEKILKIFEKRINERIPTKHDSNTVEEVNYTNGWNHAISAVREMLQ